MRQFHAHDVNTNSNFHDVVTKHTKLQLAVEFDRKILTGSAITTLEPIKAEGLDTVILDTSYLNILRASVDGEQAQWQLGQATDQNGHPLIVHLGRTYARGESLKLEVSLPRHSPAVARTNGSIDSLRDHQSMHWSPMVQPRTDR